jgi:hypothetical protein
MMKSYREGRDATRLHIKLPHGPPGFKPDCENSGMIFPWGV